MSTKIRKVSPLITSIFLLLLLTSLTSCRPKPIGYGVLLWWEEKPELIEGQVYPVYSESNIRDAYILVPEGEVGEEVPRWRMDLFNSREKAETFAADYAVRIRMFGDAETNGLAVRKEPDTGSDRVYKLREGQSVKIVEEVPEAVQIAGVEGYWYRVLTADGIAGYCFGPNLDIYDADVRAARGETLDVDPILENFLSKTFRPEEFRNMVRENRVDLRRFSVDRGTFPRKEEKTIRLVTDDDSFTFTFDEITMAEENHFIFGDSGLGVTVITPNKVVMHYRDKGENVNEVYVALDGMGELIDQEMERRDALFASFRRMGPGVSNAYGTIAFEDLRLFFWEGFDRLIPDIIPGDARGQGTVDIWYFPVPEIAQEYEGVLTFHFSPYTPGGDKDINFLYRRSEQGLRLVYIPPGH